MKLCGFAIYTYSRDTVTCSETGISVPRRFPGFWLCIGDIQELERLCPHHLHDNEYAIVNRYNSAEWTDADEVGATTIYP